MSNLVERAQQAPRFVGELEREPNTTGPPIQNLFGRTAPSLLRLGLPPHIKQAVYNKHVANGISKGRRRCIRKACAARITLPARLAQSFQIGVEDKLV